MDLGRGCSRAQGDGLVEAGYAWNDSRLVEEVFCKGRFATGVWI